MDESKTFAPEFERFFEYARQKQLRFPQCSECGRFHWYPMKRCPHCRSEAIEWRSPGSSGTLFSWTVVRHAFDQSFADRLPFIVGLVEFEEAPGVRFITNLVDSSEDDVHIGMTVEPVFQVGNEPHPLVTFRPVPGRSGDA